jgi:hypothetical protein
MRFLWLRNYLRGPCARMAHARHANIHHGRYDRPESLSVGTKQEAAGPAMNLCGVRSTVHLC